MHGPTPSTTASAATVGCATWGARMARLGLALVFLWFGFLKFFPGTSPAEGLVEATVGWLVDPAWFVPFLGVWECAIGIGLVVDRWRRATLGLMLLHMAGTFMPFFSCPHLVWSDPPFVWTLEGQYIVKNIVFIAVALMLWQQNPAPTERKPAVG